MDLKQHLIQHEILDVEGLPILDQRYVNTSGDTMTGPLTIAGTTNEVKLKVLGGTGQSANLQEWYNSSGTLITRITSSGNFGINTGSTTLFSNLQVSATSIFAERGFAVTQHNTGIQAASIQFRKSRGTLELPEMVAGGDNVGAFTGFGYSGTEYLYSAGFGFTVTGTPTSTSVKQDIIFSTHNTGASLSGGIASKERLRIPANGPVKITGIEAAQVVSLIKGATSQSANLTEWQNSSGSILAFICKDGCATFNEQGAAADFRVESDTEANMIYLDGDGDTDGALYLGGTTNGVKINKGGELTLLGTATTFEDLNFSPDSSGGAAVSLPDYVTINNVTYREFTNLNNQSCADGEEIPHKYKLSSTIYPHIHIFLKSGESIGTTGVTFTLYWELRQSTGSTNGSVALSATSAELNTTAGANKLTIYDPTGFAGSSELGAQLTLKLERTGGDAGDIIVTTYGVHYEIDSIGSKTASAK